MPGLLPLPPVPPPQDKVPGEMGDVGFKQAMQVRGGWGGRGECTGAGGWGRGRGANDSRRVDGMGVWG